jgi:transposase
MGAPRDREQSAAHLHPPAGAAQRTADVMTAVAAAFDALFADAHLARDAVYIAEGGYYAGSIIELIEARGGRAHIPSQSNVRVRHSVDRALYRQRNLVERFFNRLKHFRAIATRYNKLARNFLAAIALASCRLWIRHYVSTT